MKTIGILLLALIAGFVGYQFAYPKLADWARFDTLPEDSPTEQPEQQAQTPIKIHKTPVRHSVTSGQDMSEQKSGSDSEQALASNTSKTTTNPDEFQVPMFPSIEEVVKGWKEIPKKAFPREVTLLKEVEFIVFKDGNKLMTKVASGSKVHALEQSGDKVIITPAPASLARATVEIGDTNLKDLLTEGYERWKPKMVEYLRSQWNFKKMAKSNSSGADNPTLAGRNDKPERNADGTYPLLLASMKSGGVTEITPNNIKKWGTLHVERIGGQEYYTVIVDYTTKTMFGDFDTSAQARIRDGKVVKWIYTGSGEEVP